MTEELAIGEMARTGNCKVQTVRYYEEIGLMPNPRRSSGNQRVYSRQQHDQLLFIRHSRELGFSLDQIRQILALSDEPAHSCQEVDHIARNHLRDVESKIERLQSLRGELKRMITECDGGQVAECGIVKTLSNHSFCLTDDHSK